MRVNGARRFDRLGDLGQIGERLQEDQVHACLNQRADLDFEGGGGLFRRDASEGSQAHAQRPNRSRDIHVFPKHGVDHAAGQLNAGAIDLGALVLHITFAQLEDVGTERIGFDDLRATLDIMAVDIRHRARIGQVEQIEAGVYRETLQRV